MIIEGMKHEHPGHNTIIQWQLFMPWSSSPPSNQARYSTARLYQPYGVPKDSLQPPAPSRYGTRCCTAQPSTAHHSTAHTAPHAIITHESPVLLLVSPPRHLLPGISSQASQAQHTKLLMSPFCLWRIRLSRSVSARSTRPLPPSWDQKTTSWPALLLLPGLPGSSSLLASGLPGPPRPSPLEISPTPSSGPPRGLLLAPDPETTA